MYDSCTVFRNASPKTGSGDKKEINPSVALVCMGDIVIKFEQQSRFFFRPSLKVRPLNARKRGR